MSVKEIITQKAAFYDSVESIVASLNTKHLRLRMRFEDSEVIAFAQDSTAWTVYYLDHYDCKISGGTLDTIQMSALAALAIGIGEEKDSDSSDAHDAVVCYLYNVIEPQIVGLDGGLRPIP